MSRSSRCRGQTEPIAALVAVAAIALSLALYAGYVNDVLPGSSERTVEEPAIERVWYEIRDGGRYADGSVDPTRDPLQDEIGVRALPEGYNVYVVVTAFEGGEERVVDEAYFATDGTELVLGPGEEDDVPPPEARAAERPIPVELDPGDVRGGRLRVVVWS